MISLTLALELREAGLQWTPEPGDRFIVTAPEMVDEVFHLADMVIEARQLETGVIFAFNGTTEWALDSVAQDKTVWLPHEGQLRVRLGNSFRAMSVAGDGYVVAVETAAGPREFRELSVEDAYAQALLAYLKQA